MSRILVFQHAAYEPLGSLHPLLKKAGFRIRYANFARDPEQLVSMEGYDGLVVLGGHMGVYESTKYPHLLREMECIRQAIDNEKPVLGICLGAQLIAAALGAPVQIGEKPEIGWHDVELTDDGRADPVTNQMQSREKIFQWHGDYFQVPQGATWLAKSSSCPFQAFRYGKSVYGFQFHLEVDKKMIMRWLTVPENASTFNVRGGEELKEIIRRETDLYIEHSLELSSRVFTKYINLCHERSKLRWK
jgi:GMP synthase (glutamine-hydrolysing)